MNRFSIKRLQAGEKSQIISLLLTPHNTKQKDNEESSWEKPKDNKESELVKLIADNKAKPRDLPIQRIANLLAQHGTNLAITQTPVKDPDYFAEYQVYYSRLFQRVQHLCRRVHFFRLNGDVDIASKNLDAIAAIDELHQLCESKQAVYLGFVTLRPIRLCPVGATMLLSPPEQFVTCKEAFEVHLAGRNFSVLATPFMQQDNAVAACAQTAIWVGLRTLQRRDRQRAYTPAQISDAAAQGALVLTRLLPSREGLGLPTIVDVIRSAGYASHVLELEKLPSQRKVATEHSEDSISWQEEARLLLHHYIESEIPTILILKESGTRPGHAVIAVGHGAFIESSAMAKEKIKPLFKVQINGLADANLNSIKFISAASLLSHFVIQNDNAGPYQELPISVANPNTYSLNDVSHFIPLLSSDVFMSAEEAEYLGRVLLRMLLPNQINPALGPLLMRVYLIERHQFRKWAANTEGLSKSVAQTYRSYVLPQKLWVVELSLFEHYGENHGHNGMRLGEIVIDATGDRHELPFLFAHFNLCLAGNPKKGILFSREVDPHDGTETLKIDPITDEAQYAPMAVARRDT